MIKKVLEQHEVQKIISGGQTAAKKLGISTGGWCVRNYMTEYGPNFVLKEYDLKCLEPGLCTISAEYCERSRRNIEHGRESGVENPEIGLENL